LVSSVLNAGVPNQPQAAVATTRYPWIVNPIIDFLFVFGGLIWIMLGINYLFLGWNVPKPIVEGDGVTKFLMIMVLLGQHVFSDAHTAATYMRIYPTEESRRRFRFFCLWLPLLMLPVFLYGECGQGGAGNLVYLYLITVFWHYASQTFGISLIYCYKHNYNMERWEREIFRLFIQSMIVFVFVRMFTYREYSPRNFFGVDCPWWGPLPEWVFFLSLCAFIALSGAFAFVLLKKVIVDKQVMPIPAVLPVVTVAGIGLSSGMTSALMWLYAPPFFHGSQYIAVSMAYYLKERGLPEGAPAKAVAKLFWTAPMFRYLGLIVLAGVFIYVGIPHICEGLGVPFAVTAGVCLATFNFHHFITDAAIWRLRDPKCRRILLA
jgi:hypothetical protein